MTTIEDIEHYLSSLNVAYIIVNIDNVSIQIELPEYKQGLILVKSKEWDYSKDQIDSVFSDTDVINMPCILCNTDSIVWNLCHTCNKSICMQCHVNQRRKNHGADICPLCNAINSNTLMTNDELVNWVDATNADIRQLVICHNMLEK